jgi:hypothetical protein
MRTSMFVATICVAAAVWVPSVRSQDQVKSATKPDTTAQDRGAARTASTKPLTVSGKVSDDGKSLITDIDSEWAVSNAEMLKGKQGRRVTVKCYVDTDHNRIQILTIKKEESESKYATRYNDSAFRR